MNRAYIAAPIFNADQLRVVTAITIMLKMQEWEYFSPYEASQSIWKGRAPKDCSPEERDQVLRGNIDNLVWADTLVAWVGGTVDGRTDTGVVWEMGHFCALQRTFKTCNELTKVAGHAEKFTLAYIHPTDSRQHMNLMLAGTVDAVAYGPAQLHRAMGYLKGGDKEQVYERFHPSKHLMHEKEPIV